MRSFILLLTVVVLLASTLSVRPVSRHDRPDSLIASSSQEVTGPLVFVAIARNTNLAHNFFRLTILGWALPSLYGMSLLPQFVRSPWHATQATASDTLQSQHIRCQV